MTGLPDPRVRPWLTVAELAAITGEGQKVIRAAIAAGQIPVLHVGRYVRVPTARFAEICGITTPPEDSGAGASTAPAAAPTPPPSSKERHHHDHPTPTPASNIRPVHGL